MTAARVSAGTCSPAASSAAATVSNCAASRVNAARSALTVPRAEVREHRGGGVLADLSDISGELVNGDGELVEIRLTDGELV